MLTRWTMPLTAQVRLPPPPASGCRMRRCGHAASIEITGSAALYSSSRLHRFRRIFRGTVWTHAQGVLVEAQQDGTVA